MKRVIPFILLALLFSCSTAHEFRLKSDGTIYSNGRSITDNELMEGYRSSEIILNVENDVPYEKVVEILTKLEKAGVKKIGIKTGIDSQK
jgi:biopolymer transport protein ExbD